MPANIIKRNVARIAVRKAIFFYFNPLANFRFATNADTILYGTVCQYAVLQPDLQCYTSTHFK